MDARNFFQDTVRQFRQADEFINNVINQYIVRPTGTVSSQGVSGYVFDVVGDEEMEFDSDITDHFVDDNFAIQDHIARRPERFTLKGYVGELKDTFPYAGTSILQAVKSLGMIDDYQAGWVVQAAEQYAKISGKISRVANVVNQAQSIYEIFSGSDTSASKQQAAFKYFYELWASRMLCDVETPWMTFYGLAIERVRVVQREESRYVSDFAVTFKKIRMAQAAVTYKPSTGGALAGFEANTVISQFLTNNTQVPVGWEGRASDYLSDWVNNGAEAGFSSATATQQLLNLPETLQPITPSAQ